MSTIKKNIPAFIIIVFHIVGLIGFVFDPIYFKSLSYVNLLLTTGLVLLMSNHTHWKFFISLLGVAIIGFFIEVIGVKTGIIFGSYHYGSALGFNFFSVPLLIGILWALLIYSTSLFVKTKYVFVNAFIGACLMVLLDYFMEQQCARFDFWYWKNGIIPIQNYVAWFVVSLLLNILFQKHLNQKPTLTAKTAYITQLIFFILLFIIK